MQPVLRRKFIELNIYIRKQKSKINSLSFQHKNLEKKEKQIKCKASRRKEIIKLE